MNIGRYRIVKEIGRGSMGVVYQAEDPNLDLVVALKVLRQDRLSSDPFVRRFLSEAKALGRLDHPNIVRVFNVDQDGDTVYITMEYIEGESLVTLMKKEPFLPEAIAEFGATVAEALDSAHRKGIVHRDVKPSNILFKSDGRLKITDFGIAHIEDSSMAEQTQAGEILGTPAYMSPEQVLSRPVDGRSDLFSLGIILYELATGKRPFGGEGINAIFSSITGEEPSDIRSINPQVPKALCDVIMRCLRKDPEKRFASGSELATSLRASVRETVSQSQVAENKGGKETRRSFVPALVIAVAICAAGVAFYMFNSSASAPKSTIETVASYATLNVESTPAGAQVFVDGTLKGTAPADIRLTTGKHEVRLSMPNYYEWEAQVEMKDNAPTPLVVKLLPMNAN
ncbi:MAG: serine/threonine protein kinase [Desulfuromonadales bacterium]|nr:serine/threonine protein kinase [Desulfuromonadales bacterium]